MLNDESEKAISNQQNDFIPELKLKLIEIFSKLQNDLIEVLDGVKKHNINFTKYPITKRIKYDPNVKIEPISNETDFIDLDGEEAAKEETIGNFPISELKRAQKRYVNNAKNDLKDVDIDMYSRKKDDSNEVIETKRKLFDNDFSCPGIRSLQNRNVKYSKTCSSRSKHYFETSRHGGRGTVNSKTIMWLLNHIFGLMMEDAKVTDFFPKISHKEQLLRKPLYSVFYKFCSITFPYLEHECGLQTPTTTLSLMKNDNVQRKFIQLLNLRLERISNTYVKSGRKKNKNHIADDIKEVKKSEKKDENLFW